ncbi:hypothetical protein HZC08_02530, partial [Candidatus Micrarchaeota archaeon]|nr:hypothetical protein [Candidatus Micrarchaeota archaeon]
VCLKVLEALTTEGKFKNGINKDFKIDLSGEVPLLKKLMENENEGIRDYATNILGAVSPQDDELIKKLSKNLDDTYSLEKLAEMGEGGADLSGVLEKAAKYLDSAYEDGIFAGRMMKAAIESGKGREKAVGIVSKMLKSTKTAPNGLVLSIDLLAIASENGVDCSKWTKGLNEFLGPENPANVQRAAQAALKKIGKNQK